MTDNTTNESVTGDPANVNLTPTEPQLPPGMYNMRVYGVEIVDGHVHTDVQIFDEDTGVEINATMLLAPIPDDQIVYEDDDDTDDE